MKCDTAKEQLNHLQKVQRWALASQDARRLNAAISLARSEPGIPVQPEEFDADPWLFNCANGTIELKTGRLREHRREDRITKICPTPFDEDAHCPTWLRLLDSIFLRDAGLIDFIRRKFGQCLTGDVSQQDLTIFYGAGGNGKSTLVNAVMRVMGGAYAMKAAAAMLMAHRGDRHPTELADLFRQRLVIASEPEQGCKLNEALIKDLTGGERIRARKMKQDFWEFDPTHKIILLTNHRPRVNGTDEGIWRRLRLVPFDVRFVKPDEPGYDLAEHKADPQMGEKLAAEAPGILAWMVGGCLDWQRHGLTLPDKVKAATTKYRASEDTFAQWLEECCQRAPGVKARHGALYQSYGGWAEANGEEACGSKGFSELLEQKGFTKKVSNGVWYLGVAPLQAEEE